MLAVEGERSSIRRDTLQCEGTAAARRELIEQRAANALPLMFGTGGMMLSSVISIGVISYLVSDGPERMTMRS